MIIHQNHMVPGPIIRGVTLFWSVGNAPQGRLFHGKSASTPPGSIQRPIPDSTEHLRTSSMMAEREQVCYDAHVAWDANVVTYDNSDENDDWGGAESDGETVAAHNTERRRANE
jgi:hypothetical protein